MGSFFVRVGSYGSENVRLVRELRADEGGR